MVNTRAQAIKNAMAARTNVPGSCQKTVRGWFNAPSAGDRDGDGDADAVDGWKSEPVAKRHTDRNPPAGVPVAYTGGSHGYGHRALSLGGGKIRTTDGNGSGKVATQDLDWPEKHWGLKYVGWSDTIDGQAIPAGVTVDEKPVVKPVPLTFGIDISHYQKGFNVAAAMKQGYSFFIFKCTEGSAVVDAEYPGFVKQAKAAGALTMAYHFLHKGNAAAQANNLAAHIGDKTVPVMVDVEKGGGASWADVRAFAAECKKRGMAVKLNYLPKSYWQQIGSPALKGTGTLLNAAYPSSKVGYGSVLYPGNKDPHWGAYGGVVPKFWQFASSGKIDGFKGKVDVNAFRGSLADLKKLGLFKDYSTTAPTPAPAPTPVPVPQQSIEFRVHLAPGNKVETVAKVKSDMALVKAKSPGTNGILFSTERESSKLRQAVSDGLGLQWTRVIDNEVTIASGPSWHQAPGLPKPYAMLLAKDDPSKVRVSGRRYLDVVHLENAGLLGHSIVAAGTHLVSEANCIHRGVYGRAWREKTWPIQVQDVLREVQKLHDAGEPVVLAGDFNTGKFFTGTQLFALLTKRFGKYATHVHNGSLDQVFLISTDAVRLTEVGKEVTTKNASDHDMVSAVIRAELV